MWLRVACAMRRAKMDQGIMAQVPKISGPKAMHLWRKKKKSDYSEKSEKSNERCLKHPEACLPNELILGEIYDFFRNVPEELHYFMEKFLNFHNFQEGDKIVTLSRLIDKSGHVSEGRIGNVRVILKRSRENSQDPNEREIFYGFMDAAKKKLRQLAAIPDDPTLSEGEKKLHTKRIRSQLIGLGSIVPIIGITQFQRQDQLISGGFTNETIEILPKVNGHTLYDCTEKQLPPYDTTLGLPRSQDIAIKLAIQLMRAVFTLRSCGYIHEDLEKRNIMIAKDGSGFTLRLIDWGSFGLIYRSRNSNEDICDVNEMLPLILFGKQYNKSKLWRYLGNREDKGEKAGETFLLPEQSRDLFPRGHCHNDANF
jgi:hypothetical protein